MKEGRGCVFTSIISALERTWVMQKQSTWLEVNQTSARILTQSIMKFSAFISIVATIVLIVGIFLQFPHL